MLLASLGVLISAAYAVRTIGQLCAGPVRPAHHRTSLTRIAANDVPPEELGALVAAHLG